MADFKVPTLPARAFLHKRTSEATQSDSKQPDNNEQPNESTEQIESEEDSKTPPKAEGRDSKSSPEDDDNKKADTKPAQSSHESQSRDTPKQQLPLQELPYHEPSWSGSPSSPYHLSVIKNGVEIAAINLSKPFCVVGRLPVCDIHLEHPSISRYHAILQHRPISATSVPESTLFSTNPREMGFYLYDLGSTHGTFLNKNKIEPRCYYRVRVGQTMRFGGSSRIFVLDQSMESVQEVVEAEAEAERQEIQQKQEEYQELLAKAEAERIKKEERIESLGATWGLLTDEDLLDERGHEEMEIDPEREAYYVDDPKKALKKFFDREGLELEYVTEETDSPSGKVYTVRVMLPLEDLSGEPLCAEASQKGKKKDAVIQCALEACRILDAEDVLRQPMKKNKRKKRDWEENDYYDSDEDNFLDRTGDVDRKRKTRMKRVGKLEDTVETFESLLSKLTAVEKELSQLHKKLDQSRQGVTSTGDSLDSYMKSIGSQLDKQKQSEMKLRIHQLKKEEEHLRKLVKVAEPYRLPGTTTSANVEQQTVTVSSPVTESSLRIEEHEKSQRHEVATKSRDLGTLDISQSPTKSLSSDNSRSTALPSLPKNAPEELPSFAVKTKLIGPSLPSGMLKETKLEKEAVWQEESDEDYASWLPPEDQTGDGRTKLNEKFGY